MIIKCILLSLLITSLIYHMMIYKEPVSLECCGGVMKDVHYSETDNSPPKIIRRCFKDDSDWESFPCTGLSGSGSKCCSGINVNGPCVPTTKGGYCGTIDKPINARTGETITRSSDIGGEIDVNDEESVQLDDINERDPSIILSSEDLQENKLRERRQRLKEYQYSGSDISNITYSIEEYNRYTSILWLYLLHVFFILVLLFLLRNKIDEKVQSYIEVFTQRKGEFIS